MLKVLVVSQPCYTSAAVIARHAVSVPAANITALIRLDLNRAIAQVTHHYSSQCLAIIFTMLHSCIHCQIKP